MALIAQRRSSCERRNLQAVSDLVAICDAVQTQRTSQLLFTSTIVVCQGRQQQPLKQSLSGGFCIIGKHTYAGSHQMAWPL